MSRRVENRVAFGRKIADQSSIRQDVARSFCEIEMARLLTLKAADAMDRYGNKVAKDAYIYDARGANVGVVTCAMWSPMIKASIALASISATAGSDLWAEIYYQKELKWNRTKAVCRTVDGPFYTPARRRQTPATDL